MKIRYLATAAVGAALLAATAVPAIAQPGDGPLSQAAVQEECGEATLTFTNDGPGTYVWSYGAGGNGNLDHLDFVSVGPESTETVEVTFEKDYGSGGFLSYGTFAGPEQDSYLANDAIGIDTSCVEEGAPPVDEEPDPCAKGFDPFAGTGVPPQLADEIDKLLGTLCGVQ